MPGLLLVAALGALGLALKALLGGPGLYRN